MIKKEKVYTLLITVAEPLQREVQCYLDVFIDANVFQAIGDGTLSGRRTSVQHDALQQNNSLS